MSAAHPSACQRLQFKKISRYAISQGWGSTSCDADSLESELSATDRGILSNGAGWCLEKMGEPGSAELARNECAGICIYGI